MRVIVGPACPEARDAASVHAAAYKIKFSVQLFGFRIVSPSPRSCHVEARLCGLRSLNSSVGSEDKGFDAAVSSSY